MTPYIDQPVLINVTPNANSTAAVAGGRVTGVNADGTVNLRAFQDKTVPPVMRANVTLLDAAPADGADVTVAWPNPGAPA